MAAVLSAKAIVELTGLGEGLNFLDSFTATVPTKFSHLYKEQAVADTEEAIDIGDISTVELMVIKATTNDAEVDCDFDATFNSDLEVAEGQFAMFKPSGIVYIKNSVALEQVTYEVWIFGTA